MNRFKKIVILLLTFAMLTTTVLPVLTVNADSDVKTSTAVSNIDRYDKILTGIESISKNSMEYKDRSYELNFLTNFMLLSGYIHAYNESIKSNNSSDTGTTVDNVPSYDGLFNEHLSKIIDSMSSKNSYIKETFQDKEGDLYKGLFTNEALNVYLETIDSSKNEPIIHAKLLSEALLVESDNRLRIILKEISAAGEDNGGNILRANKELVLNTMETYKTVYAGVKTLYGLGIQTFDTATLDNYNRAYIEIYSAYDEIATKYGISLNVNTLVSEDIVNVNAADLIDLVASIDTGNPNKLSAAYLSIFAQSSTLMPFISKINSIYNTPYLNEDVMQKLQRPFGNRRKPLYLMDVDDQVSDYLKNGGTPNKARIATLTDLLNDTKSVDIALFVKRDSEASSITALGLEGNPELSVEQREKIESYRVSGLSKDFTSAVYLASLTKVPSENSDSYLKANTNYMVLNNSAINYKNSKEIAGDMLSPIYMDIYGNIVTETGYTVVPAVTNATFYTQPMLPLNASLFLNYPVFGSAGSDLTGKRSEDAGKFIISIPTDTAKLSNKSPGYVGFYKNEDGTADYTVYGSQSMLDLNSVNENGAINVTGSKTAYTFPFVPYIWHKGVSDPYRVLDKPIANMNVYYNGFWRWSSSLINDTSTNKMQLIPILDKVIVNGDGAGLNLSNLLVSEQVQKAVYEQNYHYLTSDQWSGAPDGKDIGYSNGVLDDKLLLDIAQEVARGADIGKVMVGDLGKTKSMEDAIKSRGVGGILTATIAGYGEDIHRLFHTGAKNIVTYIPNLSELPIMQNIVISIVPIITTAIIIIFFIMLIVTYLSKKGSTKELLIKLLTIIYVIFFIVAMLPTIITSGFNNVTNITSKNVVYSLLVEQENEDKGVSTLAFDSFNDQGTLVTSSPDIIHAKLSQDDIDKQLDAAGISRTEKQNSISGFLFSDDRQFISLDKNNIIYIRGGNLVTPVTALYNSSDITFKQVTVPHPTANIDVVTYKLYQDWTTDPKPHYFMPYYMMLDTLIYNSNTIAEQTYTIPLIKKYQSENKTANLASSYFSSVMFTQPDIYTKLGIELIDSGVEKGKENAKKDEATLKGIQAYQDTARQAKNALGDTSDYLGLFNILQLPGRSVQNPFSSSNMDMEAVKRTSWASNYYSTKLYDQFATYSANNSKPVAIINGYMTNDKDPALFTDTDIYVPLTFLDAVGFKHSIDKNNKLSIWGNDIRLETVIGTNEYKVDTETKTMKYAKTLKGSPVVVSEGRAMFPISMLEYWDGNVSVATDRKSACVILREFNKTGVYGDIIEKVYNINDEVREFIAESKDYLTTVSDENYLKMVSLYASAQFADKFTHSSHTLSPVGLSSGRVNYDTYLKSIFIPAKELTSSDTISLYYYIAYKYPSLVAIFAIYQIALLIYSIAKVFALYAAVLLFVYYAIRYFIFRSKSDPVVFKGIFVILAYLFSSHVIIFFGFKLSSMSINSGNDNFLSSFGASLLLNILLLVISSFILIFTIMAVKHSPSTLGYAKLTGWMGKVIAFMKSDSKLKQIASKITPNMISNRDKLEPDKNINLNKKASDDSAPLEKILDKSDSDSAYVDNMTFTSLEGKTSNMDLITGSSNAEGDNVSLGSLGSIKLGTAKVVSMKDFDKELEKNPELKNKSFVKVGDKIVDIDKSLSSKGEDKNITRINAADTSKMSNILRKEGITHETHGSSIVALANDKELAVVENKYKELLENKNYSSTELVKLKGDINNSNIKEVLKDNGIKDYTTFDKSLIMTKDSANKIKDSIKKAGLTMENVEGLKAKDKDSFRELQKSLNKKVILDNYTVYSPETAGIAKSTGKVFVKGAHSFEVNQLCLKSAENVLKTNKIDYTVKGKLVTLTELTLTENLVKTIDDSLSVPVNAIKKENGIMEAKDILGK